METQKCRHRKFSESLTRLVFFPLRSFTQAKCFPSFLVVGKIYFGSFDRRSGGRRKSGGQGGKESKQMMVPGWRFPPLRGNSSDPNLTSQPSNLPSVYYLLTLSVYSRESDSHNTGLTFNLTAAVWSEEVSKQAETTSQCVMVAGLTDDTVTTTGCAPLRTGIRSGDQCLSMFTHEMMCDIQRV